MSDVCLMEPLKCLPRDDIDHLAMVSRRLHRLLSHPCFQSAPRRVLENYAYTGRCKDAENKCRHYLETACVSSSLVQRYPRFFKDFPVVGRCYNNDKILILHICSELMPGLLRQSPWLCFKKTTLMVGEAALVLQLAEICQMWDGCALSIGGRPTRQLVDIAPLVMGCSQLELFSKHADAPSLVNWDMGRGSAGVCRSLRLYGTCLYGTKLERLISEFLIPGDDEETKLVEFKFSVPDRHQADFSLAELVSAVKERFCSVPRPNPFELVLETANEITYPGLAMDKVEGVVHPEAKNGCCSVAVAEDISYNTLRILYARIVEAHCT